MKSEEVGATFGRPNVCRTLSAVGAIRESPAMPAVLTLPSHVVDGRSVRWVYGRQRQRTLSAGATGKKTLAIPTKIGYNKTVK